LTVDKITPLTNECQLIITKHYCGTSFRSGSILPLEQSLYIDID